MFGFLGYAQAYYELDAGGDFRGMVDRNLLDRMFIYASYSIIMVILGYALARKILPLWLQPPAEGSFRNISESKNELFVMGGLAFISALVLLRVLYLAPIIAIFEAFKDNTLEARLAARSEMFYDFPGKLWWYSLFYSSFLSVCCWAAFARVLLKFDWKRVLFFIAVFIPAFFCSHNDDCQGARGMAIDWFGTNRDCGEKRRQGECKGGIGRAGGRNFVPECRFLSRWSPGLYKARFDVAHLEDPWHPCFRHIFESSRGGGDDILLLYGDIPGEGGLLARSISSESAQYFSL
jgi:hypothetical protein